MGTYGHDIFLLFPVIMRLLNNQIKSIPIRFNFELLCPTVVHQYWKKTCICISEYTHENIKVVKNIFSFAVRTLTWIYVRTSYRIENILFKVSYNNISNIRIQQKWKCQQYTCYTLCLMPLCVRLSIFIV